MSSTSSGWSPTSGPRRSPEDAPQFGKKKGDATLGQLQIEVPIPEDLQDTVDEYRAKLVEDVAESSEELMDAYLENGDLTFEQLQAGIREITVNSQAYPRLLRLRVQEQGRSAMLDGVVSYLPRRSTCRR